MKLASKLVNCFEHWLSPVDSVTVSQISPYKSQNFPLQETVQSMIEAEQAGFYFEITRDNNTIFEQS